MQRLARLFLSQALQNIHNHSTLILSKLGLYGNPNINDRLFHFCTSEPCCRLPLRVHVAIHTHVYTHTHRVKPD